MERKVMEREGMTEDKETRRSEKRNNQRQTEKEKKILIFDFKISTSNELNLFRYHAKNILLS